MSKTHILVGLLFCCAPIIAGGQAPAQVPEALVKAIHAREEAVDKVDAATWEHYTTARFTVVNATGHMLTRAERVAELRQSKPAAAPTVCGQERITLFAQGMAATRRCLENGEWWLEVWTKVGAAWQVVAVQGTPAAK